jgi:hypothetical protein
MSDVDINKIKEIYNSTNDAKKYNDSLITKIDNKTIPPTTVYTDTIELIDIDTINNAIYLLIYTKMINILDIIDGNDTNKDRHQDVINSFMLYMICFFYYIEIRHNGTFYILNINYDILFKVCKDIYYQYENINNTQVYVVSGKKLVENLTKYTKKLRLNIKNIINDINFTRIIFHDNNYHIIYTQFNNIFFYLSMYIFTLSPNFDPDEYYFEKDIMKIYSPNIIIIEYTQSTPPSPPSIKLNLPYFACNVFQNIILYDSLNNNIFNTTKNLIILKNDRIAHFVYLNEFKEDDIFRIIIYTLHKCIQQFQIVKTNNSLTRLKNINEYIDYVFIVLFLSLKYKLKLKKNLKSIKKIVVYMIDNVKRISFNRNSSNPDENLMIYGRIVSVYDIIKLNMREIL